VGLSFSVSMVRGMVAGNLMTLVLDKSLGIKPLNES
jgi:hypothetical protein